MRYVLFVCAPAHGRDVTVRLRPPADATTVRAHDGEVLISDGPFTTADEYVTAVDLVEAADLDEAIALAARHSEGGPVEVRPVWE
ncbi:YciI family protein [Streptomyces sp. S.PB5]|uniref:YciI family protein n=1 Tax=Streptomyces sp. S.PB5 TaxID=3020844 RepID=UPI0025AFD554|nr:YciI family protein [Streptomyces sp. S.PB5]MDN3024191.1 YciI family protein [Streptomyces sp. S.PB5]